ncbi:MAG TPA: M20/M25/M40 family metallo-hydrolase [Thermodesulfovibrionales bacterium]|nr:M20/M25/M40 family metallo-hydrolase [Thermodesulfovibrionales bacterium]
MEIAKAVNRDRLLDLFTELLRVSSPSFGERALGDLLADKLERLGCAVVLQEYGKSFNLLARKNGNNNALPLLLSGHMDTIEPTDGLVIKVERGVVKTAGDTILGADDKSALAQILEALTVLGERNIPHGEIEIVFSSGEEKGLHGAKNLDFAALRSRHALVLDCGGSVGKVVVAAPSHYTYRMCVTGRSAHAGIEPEKGTNAIRVASEIIAGVADGRLDDHTTANIGIITGGTATNVVAREAVVHGEIRSHDRGRLEEVKRAVFETARATAEKRGARVGISGHDEYRAFTISPDEPFLRYILGVHEACGITPAPVATGGGSDANVFHEHGIMAINISTGMEKVHSAEEYISLEDLYKGTLVVLKTIVDFETFTRSG